MHGLAEPGSITCTRINSGLEKAGDPAAGSSLWETGAEAHTTMPWRLSFQGACSGRNLAWARRDIPRGVDSIPDFGPKSYVQPAFAGSVKAGLGT